MINERLTDIRERISKACARSGRGGSSVTLVAVTKSFPADAVNEAISLGVADIGESRIQEAQTKFALLTKGNSVRKHLIGHLQTNKAKRAVELFDVIQSVDSIKLAEIINAQAVSLNKRIDCLIEIKVSDEDSKFGIRCEDAAGVVRSIAAFPGVRVLGLMAMAPFFGNPEDSRPYFRKARQVFDSISSTGEFKGFKILSMGMSNDFEVAVEEGSNMVRIGTAIFGENDR